MQERNEEGLKLIERNEELSIFYEKLNLQGMYVHKYPVFTNVCTYIRTCMCLPLHTHVHMHKIIMYTKRL